MLGLVLGLGPIIRGKEKKGRGKGIFFHLQLFSPSSGG